MTDKTLNDTLELCQNLHDGLLMQDEIIDQLIESLGELQKSLRDLSDVEETPERLVENE